MLQPLDPVAFSSFVHNTHAHSPDATAVDMSKVNIEGLKSAGFPLVMSFNDDQRQELKSLAHLLGLEKVLANF